MNIPDNEIQETIERLLVEGYAPPTMKGLNNRSSAAVAAHREFESQGRIKPLPSNLKSPIHDWIATQKSRAARGLPHFLPDWDLFPPLAARKGKLGFAPVLPGFEVTQTTEVLDKDGNVVKEFIQQRPAREGEPFELPPGHTIKGVSAYVKDGQVTAQWVKTKEGQNSPEALDAIKATFEEYTGHAMLTPPPTTTEEDLLTAYYIGDHHLGMFSWREETGFDYDLGISTQLLRAAMTDLVAMSPPSEEGMVFSLGDFFHADSSNNQTPASGHALDVDTRRAKVYKIGVKLMIECIEMALQKHKRVRVRCLPGNHDPETTPTLAIALWCFFHNEPRVDVDISSSRFFFYEWGLTMLAGTHNDMAKIQDLPGIAAAREPGMWGRTRFRYGIGGHIHHKEKFCKEVGGMICETFQVLPPPDAWHAAKGFGAGRSMTAVTYSKRRGERVRHTSSVPFEDSSLDDARMEG